MRLFKQLLAAAALTLCAVLPVQAAQVDMHDPYKMLITVADQTFAKIKANADHVKSDVAYRRDLIRTELMPYVDSTYAAYKVIGNNLKQTTKEERAAFSDAFAEYIVASYADALGKYDNQELVPPAYQEVPADENMVNIKFIIREQGKPDLELLFKLRKNTKTGEWRAYDMVAENISMLSAKQSELGPMIREQGIAKVTDILVKHNASLAAAPLTSEAQ